MKKRKPEQWQLRDTAAGYREYWSGPVRAIRTPADCLTPEICLEWQLLPWGVFFKPKTGVW